MYVYCVFSPGCISLHVALSVFSVWFHSLRFGASNEFVFVHYYICIFLKHYFCLARASARLRLFFSASLFFSLHFIYLFRTPLSQVFLFLRCFLFLLVFTFGTAVALACSYEIFTISSISSLFLRVSFFLELVFDDLASVVSNSNFSIVISCVNLLNGSV